MTELKQLRDFAEQVNGVRPKERSLKGVVNNLIANYKGGEVQNHLYRYDLFLEFQDINEDKYMVALSLLSNEILDINNNNVKDILFNYKGKSFVAYGKYDSDYYGYITIEGNTANDLYFNFNNGDNSSDSFEIANLTLSVSTIQLF